jgi:hypothetical protein
MNLERYAPVPEAVVSGTTPALDVRQRTGQLDQEHE